MHGFLIDARGSKVNNQSGQLSNSPTHGVIQMRKILSACAVASAFVAATAFAQGYIGGGLGSSKLTGLDGGGITGGNSNKSQVKVVGGFQFTPYWGAEAQYSDLGKRDIFQSGVPAGSVKASQFSIAGTGTLPLSSGFSLLGKLGFSANRVAGSGGVPSASKTSPLVGIGVSYNITPALSARLEYEDFGTVAKFNPPSVRANAYSISLKYAF